MPPVQAAFFSIAKLSPPIKPDDSVGDAPLPALWEERPMRCSYHDFSDGREYPDMALRPNRLLHEYGEMKLAAFLQDVERAPVDLTQAVRQKRRDLEKRSRSSSPSRRKPSVESMLQTFWRQFSN
ncbi:unnamed protein product [Effrenium voratum]|uniref:Uncharacterized protein n=1 Tax=Effrenium voratum TaxID=2562239 RepID=A0AA36J5E7_9DINO|nr:unnamed protein product [Effrenium voratum]